MKTLAVSGTHGHTHTSGRLAAGNVFWEVWEHWPGSGSDPLGPTQLQRLTDRTTLHCDHFIQTTWREGKSFINTARCQLKEHTGRPSQRPRLWCPWPALFSSDTHHFPLRLLQLPPHRLSPHRPWSGLPLSDYGGKNTHSTFTVVICKVQSYSCIMSKPKT